MITHKFNYSDISRTSENGKRLYSLPDGSKVPSVTTILEATKSIEKVQKLAEWRKRVGEKQAAAITLEASSRGTRMHKFLEDWIATDVLKEPGTNPYSIQSQKMAKIAIDNGLSKCSEFWGSEVNLYVPGLYAGQTDLTGIHSGKPSIMDFKQTNKPKKTEWIEDYFIQTAAYAVAHDELFPECKIEQGVIIMVSAEFQYQEWVISGDEFQKYKDMWLERVEGYYKLVGMME